MRHCENCSGEVMMWNESLQMSRCADCGFLENYRNACKGYTKEQVATTAQMLTEKWYPRIPEENYAELLREAAIKANLHDEENACLDINFVSNVAYWLGLWEPDYEPVSDFDQFAKDMLEV